MLDEPPGFGLIGDRRWTAEELPELRSTRHVDREIRDVRWCLRAVVEIVQSDAVVASEVGLEAFGTYPEDLQELI
ncbi:hypothetical protein K8P10_001990 [Leucobacter sp. Psy1]|nr:hypothetical protein K8P10_001990 [Leucobacter sp. Psy1]